MGDSDKMDITMHGVITDNDQEDLYNRQFDKRVEDGKTTVEVRSPGDIVPAVTVESRHPHVAGHELKQFVAVKNQQFQMDALPEAHRRREERRMRRREETKKAEVMGRTERCRACGGTGWIGDDEGNSTPCDHCDAHETNEC